MILLIADDHAEMRRTIRSVVEDLASTIFECADGAAAVAAYRECRPDWVLMDMQMPHLDGFQATRAITREWPAARICVVSNFDDEDLRQSARAAGAHAYVHKGALLELRSILRPLPPPD